MVKRMDLAQFHSPAACLSKVNLSPCVLVIHHLPVCHVAHRAACLPVRLQGVHEHVQDLLEHARDLLGQAVSLASELSLVPV